MSADAEPLGQRLQAAREKKGLSAQKAADELHLDGWVIEGLESGNYARIGPPVYAKGHLKRYAELLGLPVAELLADFDGGPVETPQAPQPAGMRMRTAAPVGSDLPWPVIVGLTVAALAVGGVMWWHPWHPRGAAPMAALPVDAAAPAAPVPEPGARTGAAVVTPAAPSSAARAPGGSGIVPAGNGAGAMTAGTAATLGAGGPGSGAASSAAAAAPDPKAATGRARLRLSFLADSWVDVHDANGQRLYAGNGHVNNVRSMSGEAPFRIYLKSASSIRMEINNHVVAIGPQFVVADVAHFEAGADGVLRRDPHAAPAR